VALDEILYADDNIEDDRNSMLFNPIASTISKWRKFKLLRRVHLLNQLVDLNEILYCGNGIKGDFDHSKMSGCPPLITFEPLGKFSLNLVRT
jgi:hypothetical protein